MQQWREVLRWAPWPTLRWRRVAHCSSACWRACGASSTTSTARQLWRRRLGYRCAAAGRGCTPYEHLDADAHRHARLAASADQRAWQTLQCVLCRTLAASTTCTVRCEHLRACMLRSPCTSMPSARAGAFGATSHVFGTALDNVVNAARRYARRVGRPLSGGGLLLGVPRQQAAHRA